jgi:predicted NAD/FAD-binding protein
MRIGVIGGGVSGLGAAWALKDVHEVTLHEAEKRLGGHANTVVVDYDGVEIAVDTGFIVFNAHNYPNLLGMLAHLDIETVRADMSFSLSDPAGYEWSSNGFGGMFAWKRNLTSPAFLCMLGDIVRFSTAARADLRDDRIDGATLAEYVRGLGLGRGFLRHYLLPMGAAIWSTPERDMLDYPASSFIRFFDNHRLLHSKRPKWRSIKGGSRTYVRAIAHELGERVVTGDPVTEVARTGDGVSVRTASGRIARYDHVILACHSDEALALLSTPTARERAALAAIRYAPNSAYLHRDESLMPRRKSAWAAWNVLRDRNADPEAPVCVSYWMNTLQQLPDERPLFVTLNPPRAPDPAKTFRSFDYSHPQYDTAALAAQREIKALQGLDRVSFAGAWLGYGFHEDGLASGLAAAEALGGCAPWKATAAIGRTAQVDYAAA